MFSLLSECKATALKLSVIRGKTKIKDLLHCRSYEHILFAATFLSDILFCISLLSTKDQKLKLNFRPFCTYHFDEFDTCIKFLDSFLDPHKISDNLGIGEDIWEVFEVALCHLCAGNLQDLLVMLLKVSFDFYVVLRVVINPQNGVFGVGWQRYLTNSNSFLIAKSHMYLFHIEPCKRSKHHLSFLYSDSTLKVFT